jgi:hypothetical protein
MPPTPTTWGRARLRPHGREGIRGAHHATQLAGQDPLSFSLLVARSKSASEGLGGGGKDQKELVNRLS